MMLTTTRMRLTAVAAACCMALVGATSADAATQRGLVNVNVDDVQVPVAVAANVCNVSINVITQATGNQIGECDAVSEPTANQNGGGNTNQNGLVNISLTDVQIPIGVAANVCNVSANVIAAASGNQAGDCDAVARPGANQ
jgi:hypothetical protein